MFMGRRLHGHQMPASAGRGIVLERLRHRDRHRDASERVHVDLHMGAGNLMIGGGARKLLNADFTYNVASWEPEVRYSSTGTNGNLTIRQPGQGHA